VYAHKHSKSWYNTTQGRPGPPSNSLVPTTVNHHPETIYNTYFASTPSNYPLSSSLPTPPQAFWNLASTPPFLINAAPFYQKLLGPVDCYHHFPLETVARDISDNKLLACSDGAFDSTQGTGTFGWVLATQDKHIRFRCAGPVDGHPSFTSAYRAELSGLLAVLYIIGRVCDYLHVMDRSLHIYCDNKSAIKNVFKKNYRSLTVCLDTDYDIIRQAKILLHQLPIKVKAEWVKGFSTAKKTSTPEEINIIADHLAASYADCNPQLYRPSRLPLPPPNYAVRILFDGSVITSKLYKILSTSLHTDAFIAHIMKKSKWPRRIFDMINWEAHSLAFSRLPVSRKSQQPRLYTNLLILISKIISTTMIPLSVPAAN
jgi:ribonuclease HI